MNRLSKGSSRSPALDETKTLRVATSRAILRRISCIPPVHVLASSKRGLPLPKGECRGEGEGTMRTEQCVLLAHHTVRTATKPDISAQKAGGPKLAHHHQELATIKTARFSGNQSSFHKEPHATTRQISNAPARAPSPQGRGLG